MSIALSPSLRLGHHREAGPVVRLPIGALGNGRPVRVNGVNAAHVRRLAGVAERELPPIVVQQNTMLVADGLHRFLAAQLRGASHVSVRFLDCDDLDAFVFALLANNEPGGLPLTRADRRSAADHILSVRPQWSDRRLAAVTGVAPRTVAEARDRLGSRAEVRVGMDGRNRPANGAPRRERVRELLLDQPHLSLREAARLAGVSPETVRAVRASLHADGKAQPAAPIDITQTSHTSGRAARTPFLMDRAALLQWLRNDPALRSSEGGRALLRLLQQQLEADASWAGLTRHVPPHCHDSLAAFARQNALGWRALAEFLERDVAS